MKRLIYLLFLPALFTFSSCQKDYNPYGVPEDEIDIINNLQGYFRCDYGESQFKSEFQYAYIFPVEGTSFKMLVINGLLYGEERIPENYTDISLNVAIYEGPLRYAVPYPASVSITISKKDEGMRNYISSTMDDLFFVEIAEDDGKFIKGTFNATLDNMIPGTPDDDIIELKNGEFKVPIMNR